MYAYPTQKKRSHLRQCTRGSTIARYVLLRVEGLPQTTRHAESQYAQERQKTSRWQGYTDALAVQSICTRSGTYQSVQSRDEMFICFAIIMETLHGHPCTPSTKEHVALTTRGKYAINYPIHVNLSYMKHSVVEMYIP